MINNKEIEKYYDEVTPMYVKDYGCVYQACVLDTETYLKDTLDYFLKKLNIKPNDIILDAGCGVGMVSMYFALNIPDTIYHGITISQKQVDMANGFIKNNKLENRVFIKKGDFHNLPYQKNFFDKICFFESGCYSNNLNNLVNQVVKTIKNGGTLLIKDLFLSKKRKNLTNKQLERLDDFNEFFKTNIFTIKEINKILIKNGFEDIKIEFLEKPEWTLEPFSHWMTPIMNYFSSKSDLFDIFLEIDTDEILEWAIITAKYKKNEKV